MSANKRRNFSGAFLPQDCGYGAWHLSSAVPHEIDVILQGADRGAARAFGTAPVMDLCIEWDAKTALLRFRSRDGAATVRAAVAIVHEPLRTLYDGLPLVKFDADARRFWRRVFRLVRIPGGRYLLKFLTRSGKPTPKNRDLHHKKR
jgi:hypothetical protein